MLVNVLQRAAFKYDIPRRNALALGLVVMIVFIVRAFSPSEMRRPLRPERRRRRNGKRS